mgnify:FL=1
MSRWNYQVVELKTGMMGGVKREGAQEQLVKLGQQGWELVSVLHQGTGYPVLAFLKK